MKFYPLALVFLAACPAAEAATIAAHRAIYDIKLLSANEGANVTGVEGRLAFEIQGSACEGWTVNFRMVNEFSPGEGSVKTIDTQSTSFEDAKSLALRYNEREYVDRKLLSESRINVGRSALDKDADGKIENESKSFSLEPGVMFPMQHQLHLMDRAEKGETRDSTVIYDGSDGEKSFRAITFIGKKIEAGTNKRDLEKVEAKPLSSIPAWPVSIAYFPANGDNSDTPTYQVGFDLYQNGVATNLRLDYGDFMLAGELTKLEFLNADPCP